MPDKKNDWEYKGATPPKPPRPAVPTNRREIDGGVVPPRPPTVPQPKPNPPKQK